MWQDDWQFFRPVSVEPRNLIRLTASVTEPCCRRGVFCGSCVPLFQGHRAFVESVQYTNRPTTVAAGEFGFIAAVDGSQGVPVTRGSLVRSGRGSFGG